MLAVIVLWAWAVTALSGLALLGAWLTTPSVRTARTRGGRHRRLPPSLVLSHLSVAAAGLLVWGVFALWGRNAFAWAGLGMIAMTAAIGITMFVRWIPGYRSTPPAPRGRHHRRPHRPRRRNLPFVLVVGHGALAVATIVLMVLTMITVAE
ncbi:hypothetical protein [Tomitella gaofuii]|uniref:hypothetical protein n=1 Tax=Tomitella gaofuii TaxID=2760083 RepID=UPI0015FA97F1|nr:hypothetical protein [Tomitella gaofuii]